jgi:hypothetical protein
MQKSLWLGVISAVALVITCLFPWVTIESKHIVVSGVSAEGTAYGKPGYFHMMIVMVYLALLLINKKWSNQINLFVSALNVGWAFRNFLIISACQMGECPQKHIAIYLLLFFSILMLIGALISVPKDFNRITG